MEYGSIDRCSYRGSIGSIPEFRRTIPRGDLQACFECRRGGWHAEPNLGEGPTWLSRVHADTLHHVRTADDRKFGTSVAEKAALLDTLAGYAGVYRVEGDKLILTPDVSWTENLNGKPQVETYQLSGNRLSNTLGPTPYPRDPSKKLIRRQVWEKIE